MTSLPAFIGLVLAGAGGLTLMAIWTRTLADLLYMFALRKLTSGVTVLVILIFIVLLIHWLARFEVVSPTAFLAGIVITPLVACPLSNIIAFRSADAATRLRIGTWRGFVFSEKRCALDDSYKAPSTNTEA